MKRYDLTENVHQVGFRIGKLEEGESARVFKVRIKTYLYRWVELSCIKRLNEDLRDLFLRENCPSAKKASAGVIATPPRGTPRKDSTPRTGPALGVSDNLQRESCTSVKEPRSRGRAKEDEGSPCAYHVRGDRRSRSRRDVGHRI
ncbi:hypothetical protein PoB_005179000 [Plakobranchus ocellatus]|uniref:Chromo domain-containing protein n=1 Tax=Plakobranchus ocellatus TaxID=259542 RepID=A0AAV4BXZ3_9GAST|nr:hypothetical protein PoB_005179000 [Plakobranchus ocellatus]